MKPIVSMLLVAVALTGCDKNPSQEVGEDDPPVATNSQEAPVPAPRVNSDLAVPIAGPMPWVPEAGSAAKQLGGQLKSKLQAAMKDGGPTAAIAVCHEEAPKLAAEVSEATGFTVTRVSAQPRNPDMGVPTEWQRVVLAEFEARKTAGEDPDQLTWHAEVDGEQRFMKAIPTGGVCLACHGTELQPEIATALAELYPNDEATGYEAGDIRGAFVVTRAAP
ncbi:MAG: DUF3365 domain-containing protein [Halieaceae bacterium]|jgi:hypothetical protein|nr:DUF3365 domain-containing protein [Halieaceae bacterium]